MARATQRAITDRDALSAVANIQARTSVGTNTSSAPPEAMLDTSAGGAAAEQVSRQCSWSKSWRFIFWLGMLVTVCYMRGS